ncbi:MAG: BatA domain-containing protein [Pseudomonadales bacterium]|jgi:protein-disulfide isomerase|nr:BatA domain-containing protein [Pseudomonadales bacterium]
MGLITPLFLLGLFGLALPWWLHRLETQTTEREKFSTTRFLEASKKRIHVQRKLRFLLLMALRMLFLALLALAFARPLWFDRPQSTITADTTHHVIVIDTSLSMRGAGKFAAAQQAAQALLANLGSDDIASLYAASSSVRTVSKASADIDQLRGLVATLEPDKGHLDFGQMVGALNSLIEKSQANITLHVFSDFQQSAAATRFADMIPNVIKSRPLTLDLHQVNATPAANLAVEAVVVEGRNAVVASVHGWNQGEDEHTYTLALSINGSQVQQQRVSHSGDGVFTVRFPELSFAAGDNRVDVSLSPNDTLADDDLRHAVFDNSPAAPVLLLTEDKNSLGVTYVSAALATAPRGYQVEVVNVKDVDPRIMQRYPWLIIEDIGALSGNLDAAVRDYINGGGSVFAAAGPRAAALSTLPVLGNAVSGPQLGSDGRALHLGITRVDSSHPVLSKSSGWNNVNARVLRPALTPDDRVLVAQNADNPVLIERHIGNGRLLFFTAALDNSTSDLPVKPVFVSLMAQVAQYLSNEQMLVKDQVVDSYLQLAQTGGASGQVVDPDGDSLLSLQDTTRAQDVPLKKTGYYQVFTPGGEVLVAVNADPRESDPTLMNAQALQNWQSSVNGAVTSVNTASLVDPLNREAEPNAIEIWRIFLILLALGVLAESLLGNRYLNVKTGSL